jgi:hypothetical protein
VYLPTCAALSFRYLPQIILSEKNGIDVNRAVE